MTSLKTRSAALMTIPIPPRTKASAFNSYYNDYTLGGNLEFASDWNPENNLRVIITCKK